MMTPEEFWNSYCPGETAESFAARCEDGNMRKVVAEHVARMPELYGIVCCLDWRHTFRGSVQYSRDEVVTGLMSYLELHSELWDKGATPGTLPDYVPACGHRSARHLVATELDQRKSFEATMAQFTEKDPAPPAALSLINVGVDMPEMKMPDEGPRPPLVLETPREELQDEAAPEAAPEVEPPVESPGKPEVAQPLESPGDPEVAQQLDSPAEPEVAQPLDSPGEAEHPPLPESPGEAEVEPPHDSPEEPREKAQDGSEEGPRDA